MIPLEELKNGTVYELQSRNLLTGVWVAEAGGFIGIREKFGELFLFMEYLWDGVNPTGTARAKSVLGEIPEDVPLVESFDVACVGEGGCGRPVEFDKSLSSSVGRKDGTGVRWPWVHTDDRSLVCDTPMRPKNQVLFDLLQPDDQRLADAQAAEFGGPVKKEELWRKRS